VYDHGSRCLMDFLHFWNRVSPRFHALLQAWQRELYAEHVSPTA
jgi:hypothetical protein